MEAIRRLFIVQPQRGGRDRAQDFVLGEILDEVRELRAFIRKEFRKMQQQVADALATLQAEVEESRAVDQAAITLLQGLKTQLDEALSSSEDPTEIVEQIRALSDQLNTDADALAAAVTANTPAAPDGDGTGGDTGTGGEQPGDATDPTA